MSVDEKIYLTDEVATVVAMAREGEWLCADACAFLLGMLTPKGKVPPRLPGARGGADHFPKAAAHRW